jgi:hypothetical protein
MKTKKETRTPVQVIKELRKENKALRQQAVARADREKYAVRNLSFAKAELDRLLGAYVEVSAWTDKAWGWADKARRSIGVLREAVELLGRGTIPDLPWAALLSDLKAALHSTHLGAYPNMLKILPSLTVADWTLARAPRLDAEPEEAEEDEGDEGEGGGK